jgi:Kef-type K+ transport system membrane component KefB
MIDKGQFLKATYLFNIALTTVGAIFKIYHYPNSETFILFAIIAMLTYSLPVLLEVFRSTRIGTSEKLMWVTGMLCLTPIAGYLYLFKARNRIANSDQQK